MDNISFRPMWFQPGYFPRGSTFFFRVLDRIKNVRKSVISSSLAQAKRKERSRARMSAFICRKTVESLPFGGLSAEDMVSLGTNTAIPRIRPRASCKTATTQTEMEDVDNVPSSVSAVTQTFHIGPIMENTTLLMAALQTRDAKICLLQDECAALREKCNYLQLSLDSATSQRPNPLAQNIMDSSDRMSEIRANMQALSNSIVYSLPQHMNFPHQQSFPPQNQHHRGRRRGRFNQSFSLDL